MINRLRSALALCVMAPIVAMAGPDSWCRSTFSEVKGLAGLPSSIRATLKADAPGLDGIAEHGAPFNATDVLADSHPQRRLLAAGFDFRNWVVALEHGGRGYRIEIYMFDGAIQVRKWVTLSDAHTLDDVVAITRKGCS